MRTDLIRKYDRRVPRYTSYPTAPHFHEGVTAEDYGVWLGQLPPDQLLSLYFHVPFCDTLCWFCGCHTKIVNRYSPIEKYLKLLMQEVDLVAGCFAGRRRISHLHFGGGSPTIISAADFRRLGQTINDRFEISAEAEFAVEIDPRGLSDEVIDAMAEAGVNRASIGVQDICPKVQKAINREQSFEVTESAIRRLRAAGVSSVNIDLMYGLPYQGLTEVLNSVEAVLALAPSRLALFGYAHVPEMKRHQRLIPSEALPDPEERLQQAEAAAARIEASGYSRIGLDHFARPDDPMAKAQARGDLNRNFQGYTTDAAPALVGFGASAIGCLPQGYVQNAVPLRSYASAIEAGSFATARGIAFRAEDLVRRDIIQGLMCDLEADTAALMGAYPDAAASVAAVRDSLKDMERDGIVTLDDTRVRVTEVGRPFVRCVAALFDGFLHPKANRHTQAV